MIEGFITDGGHAVGDNYGLQVAACNERLITYGGHTVGNGY